MSSIVDYAEYADELVERIDAGELDPAEVDIEPFVTDDEKTLTPKLVDRLPEELVEEYNQRWTAEAERELTEQRQEEAAERRSTLETIRETVREDEPTETMDFRGDEVEVKVDLPGKVYEVIDVANAIEAGQVDAEDINFGGLADKLIDACLAVIVDGPEGLTDRAEWERFYQDYGFEALNDVLGALVEPARERQGELKKFRGQSPGGGAPKDV